MTAIALLMLLLIDTIAAQEYCEASLFPGDPYFVGVPGNTYIYSCQGWNDEDSVNVTWYINNTRFSEVNVEGIDLIPLPSNAISSKLRIEMSSKEHNHIELYCSVEYNGGNRCNSSRSVFIIQGAPPIVSDVVIDFNISCSNNGTVTVKWNSGHSLNYSRDPNIDRYMIQIYDSLSNTVNTTTSENNFMAFLPHYSFANASCVIFNITVLPINTAGEGTPYSVLEPLTELESITSVVLYGTYVKENHYSYTLYLNPAICDIEDVHLTNIFNETNSFFISAENIHVSSSCNEGSIVVLDINSYILRSRHYKATLTLSGKTAEDNISTHDIQNITVDENERKLRVNFLTNAMAKGALLFFQSPDIDSYFLYIEKENSQNYTFRPTKKFCTMISFDIESDGYLASGINYPATYPMNVTHIQPFMVPDFNISKCLLFNKTEIAVNSACICLEMAIQNMYQFIIVNSSDDSGIIRVMKRDCLNSFSVNLTYFVSYYLSIYANNGDEELAIIPAKIIYIMPANSQATMIISNVFTVIGFLAVISHLLF